MFSLSYVPLITKPIRYTEKTANVIDHIYSKTIYDKSLVGTLVTELSDHHDWFSVEKGYKDC